MLKANETDEPVTGTEGAAENDPPPRENVMTVLVGSAGAIDWTLMLTGPVNEPVLLMGILICSDTADPREKAVTLTSRSAPRVNPSGLGHDGGQPASGGATASVTVTKAWADEKPTPLEQLTE